MLTQSPIRYLSRNAPTFPRQAPDGVLKLLTNAGQQMIVLLLMPVEWPASIKAIGTMLTSMISLDFISFASPSCLGTPLNYYARFGLIILGTVLFIGVPWLFSFVRHKCLKPDPEKWEGAIKARFRDMYLVVMLIYPTVSGHAFYFFRCQHVGNATHGTSYLMVDYTIECFDDTWYAMLTPILIIIVFFSLGLPLAYAGVLYRHRATLDDPATRRLLGIIYATFKPAMYFYESVNMLFKLVLWAILVFFDHKNQFQLIASTMICFIQLGAHARFQPYKNTFKNWLQYIVLILVALTSFGGLAINYLEVTEALGVALDDDLKIQVARKQNKGFKTALEVVLWVGIFVAAAPMLYDIGKFLNRKRALIKKVGRKLRRVCCRPCGCGGPAVEAEEEVGEDAEEEAGMEVELGEIAAPEVKVGDEEDGAVNAEEAGEEVGSGDGNGVSPNKSRFANTRTRPRKELKDMTQGVSSRHNPWAKLSKKAKEDHAVASAEGAGGGGEETIAGVGTTAVAVDIQESALRPTSGGDGGEWKRDHTDFCIFSNPLDSGPKASGPKASRPKASGPKASLDAFAESRAAKILRREGGGEGGGGGEGRGKGGRG